MPAIGAVVFSVATPADPCGDFFVQILGGENYCYPLTRNYYENNSLRIIFRNF